MGIARSPSIYFFFFFKFFIVRESPTISTQHKIDFGDITLIKIDSFQTLSKGVKVKDSWQHQGDPLVKFLLVIKNLEI